MSTGRRRARARVATTGFGAVGVTAAVSVLAFTALGGGTPTEGAKAVTPGGAVTPTPTRTMHPFTPSHTGLDEALDLFDFNAFGDLVTPPPGHLSQPLTAGAEKTLLAIAGSLDPQREHLRGTRDPLWLGRVYPDSDPLAKGLFDRAARSWWTVDGALPTGGFDGPAASSPLGALIVEIQSPDAQKHSDYHAWMTAADSPCGNTYLGELGASQLSIAHPKLTWGKCTSQTLGDGSTVKASAGVYGDRTVTVAIRVPADGKGLILLVATDFQPTFDAPLPSNPWTPSQLITALSAPDAPWVMDWQAS